MVVTWLVKNLVEWILKCQDVCKDVQKCQDMFRGVQESG